jgi:ribosome-binding factor A
MKDRKVSPDELLASCGEVGPEDGIDPRVQSRYTPRKVTNRKALQLCGQVARTLAHVFAWECRDELLQGLIVESVQPGPNSARMLVTVSLNEPVRDVTAEEILLHLQRAAGMLRSEVAAAIHRRRVPELQFRVRNQG